MLSASDAGKIGRLVLPKKCAEVRPSWLNCYNYEISLRTFQGGTAPIQKGFE